jgi:hypothetical protein
VFIEFHAAVTASLKLSYNLTTSLKFLLKLAQTFSIGFKSSEYGGRYKILMPK